MYRQKQNSWGKKFVLGFPYMYMYVNHFDNGKMQITAYTCVLHLSLVTLHDLHLHVHVLYLQDRVRYFLCLPSSDDVSGWKSILRLLPKLL